MFLRHGAIVVLGNVNCTGYISFVQHTLVQNSNVWIKTARHKAQMSQFCALILRKYGMLNVQLHTICMHCIHDVHIACLTLQLVHVGDIASKGVALKPTLLISHVTHNTWLCISSVL